LKPASPIVQARNRLSPPMRGRGLKRALVALDKQRAKVAPHAGAWIETAAYHACRCQQQSPPMRGRGLKQGEWFLNLADGLSPPMRGRGLKHAVVCTWSNSCCRPPCGGVD